MQGNISPDWKGSTRAERRIIKRVTEREATPGAIKFFAKNCGALGDYWYWFTLGTLWVSYTGFSDLKLWRKLFQANRPNRATSLMKPNEFRALTGLPTEITAYRAHREGEADWFSYTLSLDTVVRFARERGVMQVTEWSIPKSEVLALFLRRGEYELLVLDPKRVTKVQDIKLVVNEDKQVS